MKGQLYIGDDMVEETVEVVSPPQSGDLILYEGKRLRVREIAHHIEKKKLRIMCFAPPAQPEPPEPAPETVVQSDEEADTDLDGASDEE